jgi:hypothetical protein
VDVEEVRGSGEMGRQAGGASWAAQGRSGDRRGGRRGDAGGTETGQREVDKGKRSHAFPLTHDPSRIRGSKKQCLCEARGLTGKFESRAPSQLLLKMAKFMVSVDGWALI